MTKVSKCDAMEIKQVLLSIYVFFILCMNSNLIIFKEVCMYIFYEYFHYLLFKCFHFPALPSETP